MKATLNRRFGCNFGINFALFHQGDIVEELNDKEKEHIKVTDLFEAEEHNPSLYDFDCYPKDNDGVVSSKRKKKIDLVNATLYHLEVVVGYKIGDFAQKKVNKIVESRLKHGILEKKYDLPPHDYTVVSYKIQIHFAFKKRIRITN